MPKTATANRGTSPQRRSPGRRAASAKQRYTAQLIAHQGISPTDAVRDTYNLGSNPRSTSRQSIMLADNLNVVSQVQAEKAILALHSTRDAASERSAIAERLREMAIGEDSARDAISLKAIDMYARIPHVDLYREHGALQEEAMTFEGLADSITSTLMALLVQPGTGDTVVDIVAQPNDINNIALTVDKDCDAGNDSGD